MATRRGLSINEGQPFVTGINAQVNETLIRVKVEKLHSDAPHTPLTSPLFAYTANKDEVSAEEAGGGRLSVGRILKSPVSLDRRLDVREAPRRPLREDGFSGLGDTEA